MMRQFMKPERIRIIAVLAIFNYIFLGSEYLFDNMIRYATDSAGVVRAQNYVLGISVIGFLLFPSMIKKGEVDYYIGACESGGGSAISILIGLVGYNKCCTVCKNGGTPKKEEIEKFVNDGKVCFGMAVSQLDITVPVLMKVLMEHDSAK